jgi:hypothetical protein
VQRLCDIREFALADIAHHGIHRHGNLIDPLAGGALRSSNPRVPGEIRAEAILCLHTGHIGRSLNNQYPRRSQAKPNLLSLPM